MKSAQGSSGRFVRSSGFRRLRAVEGTAGASIRSRAMRRLAVVLALTGLLATLPSALASHTPQPTAVTIAGSLQSELGCPGDWQPDCAATHLTYDATRRRLAGQLLGPGRELGVQGRPQRRVGRELRRSTRSPDGANIPLNLAAAATRQVLLRPRDALGHRQPEAASRSRRAASSPSSAARATGSPTACAPGSRTRRRRHLHVRDHGAPRGHLRDQGRDQRELGRELRPGRRPGRRQHRLHRAGERRAGRLHATTRRRTS